MKTALTVMAITAALAGCTNTPEESPAATPTVDRKSTQVLEQRAHELDTLAKGRIHERAWEYYSQRCKAKLENLYSLSGIYDLYFSGWDAEYVGAKATVSGSSAQVASEVDGPAPAFVTDPKTWTYIDGEWRFDNC